MAVGVRGNEGGGGEAATHSHVSTLEAHSHYQPENGHSGLDDPLAAAATQYEGANLGSDVRVKIYAHTHAHREGALD